MRSQDGLLTLVRIPGHHIAAERSARSNDETLGPYVLRTFAALVLLAACGNSTGSALTPLSAQPRVLGRTIVDEPAGEAEVKAALCFGI